MHVYVYVVRAGYGKGLFRIDWIHWIHCYYLRESKNTGNRRKEIKGINQVHATRAAAWQDTSIHQNTYKAIQHGAEKKTEIGIRRVKNRIENGE